MPAKSALIWVSSEEVKRGGRVEVDDAAEEEAEAIVFAACGAERSKGVGEGGK